MFVYHPALWAPLLPGGGELKLLSSFDTPFSPYYINKNYSVTAGFSIPSLVARSSIRWIRASKSG